MSADTLFTITVSFCPLSASFVLLLLQAAKDKAAIIDKDILIVLYILICFMSIVVWLIVVMSVQENCLQLVNMRTFRISNSTIQNS